MDEGEHVKGAIQVRAGTLVGVGAVSRVRAGVMNFGVAQVMDTTQNKSQKRYFEVCTKCTPREFNAM